MTKREFTYELSDHLPLWIQVDTDTDEEELDGRGGRDTKSPHSDRRKTRLTVPDHGDGREPTNPPSANPSFTRRRR